MEATSKAPDGVVGDREIVITRNIAALRERVWKAFTTAEALARWWGPNGFTITTSSFDFREGGEWVFIMHGPDGRDYPNWVRFTRIEEPSRMDHDHGGDGDRVLAVDELGRPVSGDRIIALFATRLPRYRQQGGVVMTHMTNMGVEQALAHRGVKMLRTDVGDINVMNAMIVNGINLGGEQSGHIIMRDKAPSGDGILVGLQLAAVLAGSSEPLSAMVSEFVEFPQLLTNLQVKDKKAWVNDRKVNKALDQVRSSFGNVRFYLRPSGTENVVRVLTESEDRKHCEDGNRAACAVFNDWSSRVS